MQLRMIIATAREGAWHCLAVFAQSLQHLSVVWAFAANGWRYHVGSSLPGWKHFCSGNFSQTGLVTTLVFASVFLVVDLCASEATWNLISGISWKTKHMFALPLWNRLGAPLRMTIQSTIWTFCRLLKLFLPNISSFYSISEHIDSTNWQAEDGPWHFETLSPSLKYVRTAFQDREREIIQTWSENDIFNMLHWK